MPDPTNNRTMGLITIIGNFNQICSVIGDLDVDVRCFRILFVSLLIDRHTRAFSINSFTTERRSTITCPLAIFAMSPPLIFFNVPVAFVDMAGNGILFLKNGGELKKPTSTDLPSPVNPAYQIVVFLLFSKPV